MDWVCGCGLPYNDIDMSDFDPATESFERIINRHGLQIFIKLVEPADQPVRGNMYLSHGFRMVHDASHMRALTQAGVRAGYRVVLWDASHSWGRSEGEEADATFYYHHADLEDVIDWSRTQPWYQAKFAVGGHSLGGMVAGTYAAAHPRQVERLILLAPVISGRALRRRVPWVMQYYWRRRGAVRLPWLGPVGLSWEFIRSSWSYDLIAEAGRLAMPVILVVAGRDWIIPVRLARRFAKAIGANCRLIEVPRAKHGFSSDWEMQFVTSSVRNWLAGGRD